MRIKLHVKKALHTQFGGEFKAMVKYFIAQGLGVLVTLGCLIGPFFDKKWKMLVNSAVCNLLAAMNFFFLGEIGTGIVVNCVADVQVGFSLWHVLKKTKVTAAEHIGFFIAYVSLGMVSLHKPIDVLPIIAAVLFMISTFQKDEQKTRCLSIGNGIAWMIYNLIIGTSAVMAQLVVIISNAAALYRYWRKAVKLKETNNKINKNSYNQNL